MKSSILYYLALLIVTAGGVVYGLDYMSAPMTPMPEVNVTAYVPPPPPPKPVVPVVAPVQPAIPAVPLPGLTQPGAPLPRALPAPAPQAAPTPPKPLCDIAACAAAYRSFRESDCTYNPSFGPRRFCTKGVVPAETAAPAAATPDAVPSIANPESGVASQSDPPVPPPSNAQCNVSACAAAYRSFRESDCTFNPSFGPRQVCKR